MNNEIIFSLLILFSIYFFAIQDYLESIKNKDGIGYIYLYPLVVFFILAFYLRIDFYINGFLFMAFWIINNFIMSLLLKKKLIEVMGIGDYPVLFIVGTYIDSIQGFLIFIVINAIVFLFIKKIILTYKSHSPFLPSTSIAFSFVLGLNYI